MVGTVIRAFWCSRGTGFGWGANGRERRKCQARCSAVQKTWWSGRRVLSELFHDQALFQAMAGVKQNAVAHSWL